MKTTFAPLAAACFAAAIQSASAQVIVNETFDYPDTATLQSYWNNPNGLSLDTGLGNPSPSGAHSGAAAAHSWTNTTFSITPTAGSPLVLTADIYSTGAGNQRNTVGLRTGANPLFEMGMYNAFDNDTSGPLGVAASGIGVRILNLAGGAALSGQKWVLLGPYYTGWARWEATFTDLSVTIRIDQGIDSTWDITYNSAGTNAVAAFSDLRFGGPSALSSGGGGFNVDNISLVSIVPEPSSFALLFLGGSAVMMRVFSRRKSF